MSNRPKRFYKHKRYAGLCATPDRTFVMTWSGRPYNCYEWERINGWDGTAEHLKQMFPDVAFWRSTIRVLVEPLERIVKRGEHVIGEYDTRGVSP